MINDESENEKILCWNIQHGGGGRIQSILDSIQRHRPAHIILTEFRNNINGKAIKQFLSECGYAHHFSPESEKDVNSLFFASKFEIIIKSFSSELGCITHRCFLAKVHNINIFGFYFPQKEKKIPLFEFILGLPNNYLEENSLLIGDFNTGKHYQDEEGATFKASEYIEKLENIGWIDLWRKNISRKQEYSWFSKQGNGFRIDHAFSSPSFAKKVSNTYYSHKERELKISDHSILIVEIEG